MYEYEGVYFKNSKAVCTLLNFDRKHFLTYQRANKLSFQNALFEYIKNNRFKTRGLIYNSIERACNAWGCPYAKALPFLELGYSIELSCYLAINGYDTDVFMEFENER